MTFPKHDKTMIWPFFYRFHDLTKESFDLTHSNIKLQPWFTGCSHRSLTQSTVLWSHEHLSTPYLQLCWQLQLKYVSTRRTLGTFEACSQQIPGGGHLNSSVVHVHDQRNAKKRVVYWDWTRFARIAIRGQNVPVFKKKGPFWIPLGVFRGHFPNSSN